MFIDYIEGGKYIEKSGGKYTCEYIHNSGEVCGCGCRRPEGCHEHWRSKKRVLCDDCGKPTASAYNFKDLCLNTLKNRQSKIITSVGLTSNFRVEDGIEQGEAWSPILWRIFYDPLLCELDKFSQHGYQMKTQYRLDMGQESTCIINKIITHAAFMDDTTLIGNNLEGMTRLHQITKSFYKANDIKDNPNKSVLININAKEEEMQLDDHNKITAIKKSESARYLGILIDGDGKIKSQKNKILEFSRTAAAIARKKSITELQVTYLFNKVIIPAIEYKLQLCILSKQECIQIMNPFLQLFKVKAKLVRSFPTSAIKNIRLYNLTDLHNLQTQHHVTKLIIRLNSKGLMGDTTNIRLLDLQNKIWSDKCILQHIPTDPIPRGINLIYDILQLAKDAAITFCNHGTNDNTHSFNSESSTIKEILNNYKLFKQGLTFLQKYNIRFIKQLILTDGITLIKWQHLKSKVGAKLV
ncbi:15184_t:CDS:2, partial [Entrophospora sp. SA101]